MASETPTEQGRGTASRRGSLSAGFVGGLAGAAASAGFLLAVAPATLREELPAMVLLEGPNLAVGAGVHVAVGAVLGVVYAVVVALAGFRRDPAPQQVATGLVYGLATWVVLTAVVTPLWLEAVGYLPSVDLPRVVVESLIAHALYGALLGSVYYALDDA